MVDEAKANLYAMKLTRAAIWSSPSLADAPSQWLEKPNRARLVGRFWLIRGNAAKAMESMEQVAPEKRAPAFLQDLIPAYVANGQVELAVGALRKLDQNTDALIARATQLRNHGQVALGDLYVEAAATQGGGSPRSRLYMGLWMFWHHRPDEGNVYLDSVIQSSHLDATLWSDLGWAYYNQAGRLKEAIQATERALELAPNEDLFRVRAGQIYLALPEYKEKGKRILYQVIGRNPAFAPWAWGALGIYALRDGDAASSVSFLGKSLALEDNGDYAFVLANALAARGQPGDRQRAIGLLQEIIQSAPDFPGAKEALESLSRSP
jgi:tetratricopeptide (TPR) repeat protein